ncbi:MAG: hypothetical protein ACK5UY_09305 [Holosporales bacterium]
MKLPTRAKKMKRPYEMRVRTFDEEDCEFYITIKTPAVKMEKNFLKAVRTMMIIVMISKDIITNMLINRDVRKKAQNGLSIYVTFEKE